MRTLQEVDFMDIRPTASLSTRRRLPAIKSGATGRYFCMERRLRKYFCGAACNQYVYDYAGIRLRLAQ